MKHPEIQLGEWEFQQIQLSDKELFTHFIRKTPWPTNLWSSNFPYMWAYSQSKKLKVLWRIIDNLLVPFVLTKKGKLSLFCLPFGSGNLDKLIDVLYKSMNFCSQINRPRGFRTRIRTINSCQLDYLQGSGKFDTLFVIQKTTGLEKHYSINQLISLKGKKFESIRKSVNRYSRKYPTIKIREYHPSDYKKILKFNRYWEKTAGKKYLSIFDKVYFKAIVMNYKELDMIVLVAELDDEVVGVNIGGLLPTGEAWGCICKTEKTIPGLYEALVLEMVKDINHKNSTTQYLNVGSDMGIEGLRKFKEKFKPVLNLERYKVFLRDNTAKS